MRSPNTMDELTHMDPSDARPVSPAVRLRDAIREFAYGMTGYEFVRHAVESRVAIENLFLLAVIGDMVGLPVMPPYYSLRVLPYVVPEIATWKRRVLREREFTSEHAHHLHGV